MNFEDLQNQWAALDQKLEAGLRLNAALLREAKLDKTKSALQRLSFFIWLELACTLPVLFLVGSFLARHFSQPAFFIPGLVLHLAAIGVLGSCIHQLVLLNRIDYAGPVLVIQKRLEALRLHRIRATKWTFLTAPLLWTPLFVVTFKALGVNAWAVFPMGWMVGNLLFGVLVMVAGIWVSKRFGNRISGSPFMKQVMDDIAGRSLNRAAAFVATLAEFEDESPAR
ncbi:MAG: hypothetical protein K1Y36_20845 [Blastocatellia bacterium]|nr:hypothetical protein [Blastocatellia bacterium]